MFMLPMTVKVKGKAFSVCLCLFIYVRARWWYLHRKLVVGGWLMMVDDG